MSSILRVLLTEVPASLDHKTQVFVEEGDEIRVYIGDSDDLPVEVGRIPRDKISTNAIDDGDSPYTVTISADREVVLADDASGSITVNLPTAVGVDSLITVKKLSAAANTVTVTPDGSETIDGDASYALEDENEFVTLVSDGSNWFVI